MDNVVIVGSGASGVHFALSLLRKGYDVHMLDVGARGGEPINQQDSFVELKTKLIDPAAYFLGEDFSGVFLPEFKSEYYGIPPNKSYVIANGDDGVRTSGFSPLWSFAQGGWLRRGRVASILSTPMSSKNTHFVMTTSSLTIAKWPNALAYRELTTI